MHELRLYKPKPFASLLEMPSMRHRARPPL